MLEVVLRSTHVHSNFFFNFFIFELLAYEAKAFGLRKKEDSPLFSRMAAIALSDEEMWSLGFLQLFHGHARWLHLVVVASQFK